MRTMIVDGQYRGTVKGFGEIVAVDVKSPVKNALLTELSAATSPTARSESEGPSSLQ